MIAANFAPKNRYQIIMWGLLGALVFRIIFAVFASYLFGFAYIKIFGGLLLVWIVNDLRRDLFETKKKLNLQQVYPKNHHIFKGYIKCFLQI